MNDHQDKRERRPYLLISHVNTIVQVLCGMETAIDLISQIMGEILVAERPPLTRPSHLKTRDHGRLLLPEWNEQDRVLFTDLDGSYRFPSEEL